MTGSLELALCAFTTFSCCYHYYDMGTKSWQECVGEKNQYLLDFSTGGKIGTVSKGENR